ncbi:MAG: endonuclease III [Clostridia bacterium]|nr:endonuclease III [Clostridia bacterium]
MTKKERALACVNALKADYPDSICSLDSRNPYELLVATRLSAQCTDARVNLVTPALFEKYPTPVEMAKANVEDVEEIIRSTGFFRSKAKDLVIQAQQIIDNFDGKIPDNIDDLTSLAGVGRKTANLVAGDVYGMPGAVVADTHLIRISNRLGFVDTKDPKKVEFEMRKILPPEESNDFCHRCVLHGRAVCTARKAHCENCSMEPYCKKKM